MKIDWRRVGRTFLQALTGSLSSAILLMATTDLANWKVVAGTLLGTPIATALAAAMNVISESIEGD